MKKETKKTPVMSNFDKLEKIILNMEKLSGLCHVCAAAFDNNIAYSIICEDDASSAFYNVADQIESIIQELSTLLWDTKLLDQEEETANQLKNEVKDYGKAEKEKR